MNKVILLVIIAFIFCALVYFYYNVNKKIEIKESFDDPETININPISNTIDTENRMRIEEIGERDYKDFGVEVLNNGIISNNKGVNIPDVILPIALAFIMFSLGLGLSISDFTRIFLKPKD